MATRTITAANAAITFTVPGLFDTPFTLQGFAADDIFDTDDVDNVELSMGLDSKLSAGWSPKEVVQKFMMQANSVTLDRINQWAEAERTGQEKLPCSGSVTLPSIGKKFALTNGYLTKYKPMPGAKKKLEPVPFTITWESVSAASS